MAIVGCSCGRTTLNTRVISEITISRAMALIHGLTREHTLENGEITRCMVKEYSTGQIAEKFIEANIEMIKNMDTEKFVGLMAVNMLDSGLMESSMDLVNILTQEEKLCKENGIWGRGSSDLVI